VLVLMSLGAALYIPRRRVWIRVEDTGRGTRIEYAALARGDDPRLVPTVNQLAKYNHRRNP
jgi:cytochrome c biogenesis protein